MMQKHVTPRTFSMVFSVGLPGLAIACMFWGMQSSALVGQLAFSVAGALLVFGALVFVPYLLARHAQMRTVYARYDAIQAMARIRAQRTQHYTLNRALVRHQRRGAMALVRSL